MAWSIANNKQRLSHSHTWYTLSHIVNMSSPTGKDMFKVNDGKIGNKCKMNSKLTIEVYEKP